LTAYRYWRLEVDRTSWGVQVNAIASGAVETPLTAQMKESPEWYEAYAKKSILGRWAKPQEIVGMMVYLASDASSYATGAGPQLTGATFLRFRACFLFERASLE
jgi:NAD(P)-dependent dehydrogenase (short-subunit alcohol dehydrogenase family)